MCRDGESENPNSLFFVQLIIDYTCMYAVARFPLHSIVQAIKLFRSYKLIPSSLLSCLVSTCFLFTLLNLIRHSYTINSIQMFYLILSSSTQYDN
jgi:hypothetical protein